MTGKAMVRRVDSGEKGEISDIKDAILWFQKDL